MNVIKYNLWRSDLWNRSQALRCRIRLFDTLGTRGVYIQQGRLSSNRGGESRDDTERGGFCWYKYMRIQKVKNKTNPATAE